MLIKLGESVTITPKDIESMDMVLADPDILNRFAKFAAELKSIAPKAKDFLYFSAIMMHAAEAALLDTDGSLKKDSAGKDIIAKWEKKGESLRWVCSDPSIKPYKNSNADIFPEEELIKAHKRWIGRPLCLDHKSNSVDMIRGVIVDTYYDRPNKRVVALCALDKLNYPELARKVSTGYAHSVSMGTAVGKAICSDCGNVARIESEFCDHMRHKSCYGEINVDLNPIELSIVVNGADPKAKIRHIVAAADSIARYVDQKEQELSKLASDESGDIEKAETIAKGLANIKKEVEKLEKEIAALGQHEKMEAKEEAAEEPEKSEKAQEKEDEGDVKDRLDLSLNPDGTVKASALKDLEITKLASVIKDIHQNLNKLKEDVNKLSEDTKMTIKKSYFQGGGDGNEPTPGKPKYEKEDEDSIRAKEDKQMGGQMDTGPVDGMHPGYDSFGESEEARKKRLQRLASEQEERKLRREAALQQAKNKLGYFQGGGDGNEPTPGKAKYEKEDSDKTRDKEDKQMVGQPPFPGVGAVDGLHPSPASADVKDELKRKQMLSRAKLNAKFIQAADPVTGFENFGESRWQVYADKKLILTATVKEISGGNVDAMYDTIATEEYGKKILGKIRSESFDKVVALYKGAAGAAPEMAPMAAPAMAGGPGMGEAPAMGDMPAGGEAPVVDDGGTGDPKEKLDEDIAAAENAIASVREGVNALVGNTDKVGDEFDQLAGGAELPPATAELVQMRKALAEALVIGFKEAEEQLTDNLDELRLAKNIYSNESDLKTSDAKYVKGLVVEAQQEARRTISDTYKLMEAFGKYAEGSEDLVAYANASGLSKTAQVVMPVDKITAKPPAAKPVAKPAPKPVSGSGNAYPQPKPVDTSMKGLMPDVINEMNKAPAAKPVAKPVEHKLEQGGSPSAPTVKVLTPEEIAKGNAKTQWMPKPDAQKADDSNKDENDMKMNPDGSVEGSSKELGEMKAEEKSKSASAGFDKTTKEGRAAWRAKLAEKGVAFSDMLKVHPGGFTTELDVKPSGDLAKVETLEEVHKAMLDVAEAPPKVRKQAADIQKLVLAGRIDPTDQFFDTMIAQGLDSAAVAYWKKFYGEMKDGGSQFASDLVKQHAASKAAEEQENYRVKLARAYEVAYDMVRRGMLGEDRHALNVQVNELMKFNDEGFSSFQRWVERTPMQKNASIPQVGMMGSGEIILPAPEAAPSDFMSDLERAFANRKY